MHRGPKRNVCRYFMASGQCQYGEQCQFLHVRSGGQLPAERDPRKPPPASGESRGILQGPLHRGLPLSDPDAAGAMSMLQLEPRKVGSLELVHRFLSVVRSFI